MTTQHTPGPWTIRQSSNPKNGTGWRDIIVPGEFGPMYLGEALESNARLIAAAPELLEALEQAKASIFSVLDLCQVHNPVTGTYNAPCPFLVLIAARKNLVLINSAIAKARGKV